MWIDILQELLPSSLLEQFQQKEDEYLWIQEILTELELIVDSTEQAYIGHTLMINRKNITLEKRKTIY